jgi:formate hydrogenlyase subunit 3/multisubunit Na+/H+ antiporter MnhD subunit
MTGCTIAMLVLAGTGLLALPARRGWVAVAGAIAAAGIGVPSAVAVLAGGAGSEIRISWAAPIDEVRLGLDALSAFFVVPLLVLGACCAVYGLHYLAPGPDRTRRAGRAAALFNLMVAAMLLVVLARDAIVLVIAWEVMTLTSYLLVIHDHHEAAVRRAGWVYLIAGHLGVACLLALFVLLGQLAGGFGFAALSQRPAEGAAAVVAGLLAVIGFGTKAGLVPFHVWLPEAHAAAPSHVSALMSGVLIKLGIYGLLRTLAFLAPGPWWGAALAVLGGIAALVGIALALYQRDLKRALAYSSIENVGVIVLGLGVGSWAAHAQHPRIAALVLCGALLHLWNHVMMKGLMFLSAGAVLHGSGTRDLERMGGLMHRLPRTGALITLGAVAIAGLPPLAGFASEWLVYRGLIDGGIAETGSAGQILSMLFALAALAAVGVLATLCFVRIVGVALLGHPRGESAAHAHEPGVGLLAPMAVLAAGIVAMPFVAPRLMALLGPVVRQVAGVPISTVPAADALVPIAWLSLALWVALAGGWIATRRLTAGARADDTWGCGYAAPTPRMQYTSGSFTDALIQLLPRALRARTVVRREAVPFPRPGQLVSDRDDPFTRSAYEPLFERLGKRFAQLRWVQQGVTHLYVLYIVVTVVGGVAAVAIHDWWVLP